MAELILSDNQKVKNSSLSLAHKKLEINDAAFLSLTGAHSALHTTLLNDFKLSSRKTAMHFILNGHTHFTQNSKIPPASFIGDKCNLMLIQPYETVQTMCFKGDFKMASFYIDLDKFISLLGVAIEAIPDNFKKAILKDSCSCNNFEWSPPVYNIIMQLLLVDTTHSAARLFAECKMLELLSILLQSKNCDTTSKINIRNVDKEKIQYACEILLRNLNNPPSLQQLARYVATNEFFLKKAFKEIYGKPVYQYVFQRKMEKAMEYIMMSKIPISEIGSHLGYEDASAFTRAFCRYFNQKPTDVRRFSSTLEFYSVSA